MSRIQLTKVSSGQVVGKKTKGSKSYLVHIALQKQFFPLTLRRTCNTISFTTYYNTTTNNYYYYYDDDDDDDDE